MVFLIKNTNIYSLYILTSFRKTISLSMPCTLTVFITGTLSVSGEVCFVLILVAFPPQESIYLAYLHFTQVLLNCSLITEPALDHRIVYSIITNLPVSLLQFSSQHLSTQALFSIYLCYRSKAPWGTRNTH